MPNYPPPQKKQQQKYTVFSEVQLCAVKVSVCTEHQIKNHKKKNQKTKTKQQADCSLLKNIPPTCVASWYSTTY